MTPKLKRTLTAVLCILSNLLIVLAMVLAMSGCAQEQEAPQPIIVNVTAPEPETPAEPAEPPVVAEPEPELEPAPDAVEEAPAVEEPAEDPEVLGILAFAKSRVTAAYLAWNHKLQERGNEEYIKALDTMILLIDVHGWTEEETLAALQEIVETALQHYADDLDALARIFDGIMAFNEALENNEI